jgi:hypothetical protein
MLLIVFDKKLSRRDYNGVLKRNKLQRKENKQRDLSIGSNRNWENGSDQKEELIKILIATTVILNRPRCLLAARDAPWQFSGV